MTCNKGAVGYCPCSVSLGTTSGPALDPRQGGEPVVPHPVEVLNSSLPNGPLDNAGKHACNDSMGSCTAPHSTHNRSAVSCAHPSVPHRLDCQLSPFPPLSPRTVTLAASFEEVPARFLWPVVSTHTQVAYFLPTTLLSEESGRIQ